MQAKIGNKAFINSILKENDIKIKKKFGQNFLVDNNILNGIVNASELNKNIGVIEIGPGLGSLTEHLVNNAGFVLCYEIDSELISYLEDNLKSYSNFKILNQDILEADINNDIETYFKNYDRIYVVANLPYYITTPIILGLLEKTDRISKYVMMMQKEVADRICGNPKTKDYNALSIAIKYRAEAKKAFNVSRECFIPAPNVDSSVIVLNVYENKKYNVLDEELFFKFIRLCFSQRRKTLINNLQNYYDKDFIVEMLNHFNIKLTVRSEELDIIDFINFSDYIVRKGDKND